MCIPVVHPNYHSGGTEIAAIWAPACVADRADRARARQHSRPATLAEQVIVKACSGGDKQHEHLSLREHA